jgi:hypothetical protein
MPSSGRHPDSELLLKSEAPMGLSDTQHPDVESDTPVHRHLVVFSYRTLDKYLSLLGFQTVRGHAFGLYPFPDFMQPLMEKVDPYHCHQMVLSQPSNLGVRGGSDRKLTWGKSGRNVEQQCDVPVCRQKSVADRRELEHLGVSP